MNVFNTTEIAAALLQAAITLGLAGLFFYLHRRYRKPHFLWWSVAWALYAARLGAIITFLATDGWAWLYWHQVTTGWTALAVLWAALVFSQRLTWRPGYLGILMVPVVWSWIAIFRLNSFMLAAGVTVVLLSGATLWTGVVFMRYRRRTGSSAAGILAVTLLLWGLHHLDYPILRARGAWNPWGYYLDLLFVLAMGTGILLLVIEEMRQGLVTLSALSGDLRRRTGEDPLLDLLRRPLTLRGVRGAALVERRSGEPTTLQATGDCARWIGSPVPAGVADAIAHALGGGRPAWHRGRAATPDDPSFVAVLPVHRSTPSALVVVADVAAPFAALDDGILVAVGDQIGAALENLELDQALGARSADLERLSVRMIQQHEEQRSRIARELHDETAQVFAGLKLQLGALGESLPPGDRPGVDRLLGLVDAGSRSIRRVTDDLRPALLDDLGLLPALRALISDFREWSGLQVEGHFPEQLPSLGAEPELAIFRAVQEGLSNAARHAEASTVLVTVEHDASTLRVAIEDDGVGLPAEQLTRAMSGAGRSGLFGMRERIVAAGGTVVLGQAPSRHGLRVAITLPMVHEPR